MGHPRRRLKRRQRHFTSPRRGGVGNPRRRLKRRQRDLAQPRQRRGAGAAARQELRNYELGPAIRTCARLSGLRRIAFQHVPQGAEKLE